MIQGNAKLVVDLGNSSTKSAVVYKPDGAENEKIILFERSNQFGIVINDDTVTKYLNEYDDKTSVVIKDDAVTYCNGEIQQINYPSALRPTAKIKKFKFEGTPITYKLAFLNATRIIMKLENVIDPSELDITWNVVTLLPPGDIDSGKDELISIIKNIKEIDSILPKYRFDIKIDKVIVLPEGLCAYMANVFNTGRKVRTDYKYLCTETVLVADIGAGTTDFILVKNNKLVQDSKYSAEVGGNNVAVNLTSELRKKGIQIKRSSVESTMSDGYIRNGASKIDIKDDLDIVKKRISSELNRQVVDYFESVKIDTSEIGYIVICGGGSIDDRCGVSSLGRYVANSFKQIVPNAEIVEPPVHQLSRADEKFDISDSNERISPRELNLIGACIMAESLD